MSSSKNTPRLKEKGVAESPLPNFQTQRKSDIFPEWLVPAPHDPDNPPPLRIYYPFPHLQGQFDDWEAEHPGEIAPGADGNLSCFQDGPPGRAPPYALRELIAAAIHGSPQRKLTVREIRVCLIRRFAWFASQSNDTKGWQSTVRWNLNQSGIFRKLDKSDTKGDKGAWWTLKSDGPPDVTPYKNAEHAMHVDGRRKGKEIEASPDLVPWADNIVSFSISPGDTVSEMNQSDLGEQRDDTIVIRADEDNADNSDSNEADDLLDNVYAFTQIPDRPGVLEPPVNLDSRGYQQHTSAFGGFQDQSALPPIQGGAPRHTVLPPLRRIGLLTQLGYPAADPLPVDSSSGS